MSERITPDERATLRAVCEAGSEHATVLLPKSVVLALLDLADRAETEAAGAAAEPVTAEGTSA